MLFPASIEEKLGFHQLRDLLSAECHSDKGKVLVHQLSFQTDPSPILTSLQETREMKDILLFTTQLPRLRFNTLDKEREMVHIEGLYLEVETLVILRESLENAQSFLSFFRKQDEEKFPLLRRKAVEVQLDPEIVKRLYAFIDEKGRIRDNASVQLSTIRTLLNLRRSEADKKLDRIFRQVKKEGWTEEGLEPTIRNGRVVIPMIATHKRKIRGFIHDESSTGHTVFLEPEEIFETNNEIRELELEERREIIRILTSLADFLRPHLPGLESVMDYLGWLDFVQAKAMLAIKTDAVMPRLEDHPGFEWQEARHPLLYLSHQSQGKQVVPLTITLHPDERIMVISGPNAGGKSVCLKSVGLLQYMFQCGLLIPCREGSSAGIFRSLFIDIGDEQFLENDLSTYSSHLLNMQFFLDHADGSTLFLIDEFGSGTEPQVGGAIAEVVLEALNEKKSFGVVTTHYTNLKLMAGKVPGIVNGAMAFDRQHMEPLFLLQTGKPGSSFAFEIAKKIGLDPSVIEKAAILTGRTHFDFDHQLQDLEKERKALHSKNIELRVADDFLAEMIDKYEKLARDLEQSKRKILDKAREEAGAILSDSNRLIEKTIREIREQQADKVKTRQIRETYQQEKEHLENKLSDADHEPRSLKIVEPQKTPEKPKAPAPESKARPAITQPLPLSAPVRQDIIQSPGNIINTGDYVKIPGQTTLGKVDSLKGKDALVLFGSMKMRCRLEMLEKATNEEIRSSIKQPEYSRYSSIIKDLNDRLALFQSTIDLRGKRAEEALNELQHYVDEAILLEIFEIRILHGKGDGILRELVRKFLSSVPEVKNYRDEVLELGGHGITVVSFR